jgi:predicted RND superfamily exporter protein
MPGTENENRFAAYQSLLERQGGLVLLLCLLIMVTAAAGLARLDFDADARQYLAPDHPERIALEAVEKRHARGTSVVFVLAPKDSAGPPAPAMVGEPSMITLAERREAPSAPILQPAVLAAIHWLQEEAWQIPHVTRVFALTNEPHSYAVADEIVVTTLVPEDRMEWTDQQRLERHIAQRPDLIGRLISPDTEVTSVVVLVDPIRGADIGMRETSASVALLAERFRLRYPDIELYLSGGLPADVSFAEAARRDLQTLGPVMALLIVVVLGLGLRSLSATLSTLMVIAATTITSMGLGGWMGFSLNASTGVAPILIMTLALAHSVHLIISTQRVLRSGAASGGSVPDGQATDRIAPQEAVFVALRLKLLPMSLASFTTLIGFLALHFSEAPPFQELGTLVALGIASQWIFAVTLLPVLLSRFPPRAHLSKAFPSSRQPLLALARFAQHRQRGVIIVSITGVMLLAAAIPRLELNDDFLRYFDESYAFRVDTDFIETRLTGINALQFSLPAGQTQGVTEPEYLQNVARFVSWLRAQPGVTYVSSVTDTLQRLHRHLHEEDPMEERIPDQRDLIAQLLLLYELSLPPDQDLGIYLDVAYEHSLVTAFVTQASSADLRRLAGAAEDWLATHAPASATHATGLPLLYANLAQHNLRGMLIGTAAALLLITIVLSIAMRSLRLGLISLIPNLLPAIAAFGLWSYFAGEINLAATIIGVMTLGIIVDDTVHLLAHYRHARRTLGLAPDESIQHSIEHVGGAILLTSIALILGFSTLALSGFAITAQMGLLCAATISVALLADLVLLPALLGKRDAPHSPYASPPNKSRV